MRYDFNKMDADSFELMIRSLSEGMFGIKCKQYGLGPDGQREFVYEGSITDKAGNLFEGRTIGQVKYKYPTTREDDFTWLKNVLNEELNRFRKKETEFRPDNFIFYTNIVLTPAKDVGIKDRIDAFLLENNDIIPNVIVLGYDEICAMLNNNRDVAICYSCHILPGDVLMQMIQQNEFDYSSLIQKYLARELEEDMYTRMEQAGSVTEKKISIEKVCVDIDVINRKEHETFKFANHILNLGNGVLGYRKDFEKGVVENYSLKQDENFVLIGGPGRGKTTICQFIAQIYRANYLNEIKYGDQYSGEFINDIKQNYLYDINCFRIPFKITLRDYAAWIGRQNEDSNISIVQYIRMRINKITGENVSISNIRQMLKEMAWIFFFDGLDEVPESSNRVEVLKQINLFITTDLREEKCDCMIIGTSRQQGYNNDFDETNYSHLDVAELSREDCEKYIIKLFDVMEENQDKREEYINIMKEAMDDETTNRLLKTPLQVTIISILVKSGGKPPHERYSLFRQYYETMVRREKQKGVLATLNDHTDWIEEIHLLIADKLQRESEREENASAEISVNELKKLIENYISENLDEYYECVDDISSKTELFVKTVTERLCFLGANREGYYSFSIRTMQEYFAGTFLVKGIGDENAMQNIRDIAYKSYWRNVLLFALGYIELEKKNLEKEIGSLCYEMNGRDNIIQEDYTAENICLFGSWLALDILSEDIFKGKEQNKYIEIAVKALPFYKTSNFKRFAYITGVQFNKMVSYIKEKYLQKQEYHEEIFQLYIKMAENDKNHVEIMIDELFEQCDEKHQIDFNIQIIENAAKFNPEWVIKWEKQLLSYILEGKVKQFFSKHVLIRLLQNPLIKENDIFKKFMFEQSLFNHEIPNRYFRDLYVDAWMEEIRGWLSLWHREKRKTEINITPHFKYRTSLVPTIESIHEFKNFAEKLNAQYFVALCEYVLEFEFHKYIKLLEVLEKEPIYLKEKYKRSSFYRAPSSSQEEYDEYQKAIGIFYEMFNEDTIKDCMKLKICPNINFSATCVDSVFDTMYEKFNFESEELSELNEEFFRSFLFAAHVQIDSTVHLNEIQDKTLRRLLLIFNEIERRGGYAYYAIIIMIVLVNTKYKECILEKNLENIYAEQQLIKRRCYGQELLDEYSCILEEHLNSTIISIVQRCIISGKENNYLQLIPLLVYKDIDCTKLIAENEIKELEQISYRNPANQFVVYLLKLYCDLGDINLIDEMLKLNVQHDLMYGMLLDVFENCKIKNYQEIGVKLYLMLESEECKERSDIQQRFVAKMIENRCDILR